MTISEANNIDLGHFWNWVKTEHGQDILDMCQAEFDRSPDRDPFAVLDSVRVSFHQVEAPDHIERVAFDS